MGWFDGSSSDEEDSKRQNVSKATTANDDEEEDPLDAFMNNLNEESSTPSKKKSALQRLDFDNEEEATSHWKLSEGVEKGISQQEVEYDDDDDMFPKMNSRGGASSSSNARQALNSTFVKAGSSNKDSFQQDASSNSVTSHSSHQSFHKDFWNVQNTLQGRQWQQNNQVHCTAAIYPIYHFEELRDVFGLELLQTIQQLGYHTPTTVQSQTLPVALSGRDALITAATGQGKTLSYIWPIAVHLSDQAELIDAETGPIALVVVPTRELAIQVHKQAKPMLAAIGCSSKAVIGGQGKYLLQQELKKTGGVDLVVATPGRFLDVLSDRKGLSLRRTTFCVLDEADKMLQMGFESQVRQILSQVRSDRQTLLLSATMGRRIEKVATEWLRCDYVRISVGRTGEASANVQQHVLVLPDQDAKKDFLLEMLPTLQNVGRTLVFVATRESCETLASSIRAKLPEVKVDTLHGDKHQSDRNAALRAFTNGKIQVMIATDVASRGLDVPQVATVLNFDTPKNLDAHVHRIGRAGRLSKNNEQQTGTAYTLLTTKDADFAHVLRNAFEREGREISRQLRELASKSRKAGNVVARSRWNKLGLGHDERDLSHEDQQSKSKAADGTSDYYGPLPGVGSSEPPAKRSRWG